MTRARLAVAVLLVSPLLLAAGDPPGDVGPCPHILARSEAVAAPDLVEARGEIVELGTSIRFTLRFAEPLVVPDGEGHPFRIDVVLFDPDAPAVDAGMYRGLNRILRYDAVPDAVTTTLLLPEAGQSRFLPPTIDGDTYVLQVPGRTVVADEDETGASPGVGQLRWSVVVRDEGSCDLLRSGRPTLRLVERVDASPVPVEEEPAVTPSGRRLLILAVGGLMVAVLAGVYLVRRRARNPG
ncbi:MAG TPA: hypothetical protein VFI59_07760 [Actinomycetota bacterium]|nr:hypothetical protein [Actinomycetota bacterium]